MTCWPPFQASPRRPVRPAIPRRRSPHPYCWRWDTTQAGHCPRCGSRSAAGPPGTTSSRQHIRSPPKPWLPTLLRCYDRCVVVRAPGLHSTPSHADTADMSGCCDPCGCNDMFGPRFARHLASRYRKRGLDKTAARMVAYIVDRGLRGASILEIGGGVGDIQLELLGQGASRTTNLELVDAYDTDATELAETAGMRDRMTRRQVDIAATPDEVEAHDIVVLHRVVLLPRLRASPDRGSRPCPTTAGVQPPTPQLADPDVHPTATRRFPTDRQILPDLRPSAGSHGRRR